MTYIIQQLVKNKLNTLTTDELLRYAHEYQFSLTKLEAEQILFVIQTENLDPFQASHRRRFFQKLEEITDLQTAKNAENLLYRLVEKYGLSHLLEQ
ncbi:MAG TPA: DUF2624 family protein [Bacillota bacterium]|nr:DUF2624 family protein [Bacillota bacterium]